MLKHHSKFLLKRILSFKFYSWACAIGISPLGGMKTDRCGSPNWLGGLSWNRHLKIFWICKWRI